MKYAIDLGIGLTMLFVFGMAVLAATIFTECT